LAICSGEKSLIVRLTLRNTFRASIMSTWSRRASGLPRSKNHSSQGTVRV
jgi:hypothetical protein